MTARVALDDLRAFFGPLAAGWEERYPADNEQFARAIAEIAPVAGATVLDLGCGTGRALPHLRTAVGAGGRVLGLDATPEMLREGVRLDRGRFAALVIGDVARLPFPDAVADLVFAGGLLPHLDDPIVGLTEMARVTRAGGRLAIFHAVGRVPLAARHDGSPSDDDVIAPARLHRLLQATGWELVQIDDAVERYLALATRPPIGAAAAGSFTDERSR